MDADRYWSVEQGAWVPARDPEARYWSVQRCRWEPVVTADDDLPTPWSMFRSGQPEAEVPAQRAGQDVPVGS